LKVSFLQVLFATLVQVLPATLESNGGNAPATASAYSFLKETNPSEPNSAGVRQNLNSHDILKEDSKQELNTAGAVRNLIVYDADGNSTATVIPAPNGCRLICAYIRQVRTCRVSCN
jgi:hypothetical protein